MTLDSGSPLLGSDLDFGANPVDGSRDRGTGQGSEHADGCIPRQDTYRTSSGRRTERCPDYVVASYHSGAVSPASREAVSTNSGSCGWREYA